jgi:hypothetical protein
MLTSEQFDHTRKLALRLVGIELCERHRELLRCGAGRIRRTGTAIAGAEEARPVLQLALERMASLLSRDGLLLDRVVCISWPGGR